MTHFQNSSNNTEDQPNSEHRPSTANTGNHLANLTHNIEFLPTADEAEQQTESNKTSSILTNATSQPTENANPVKPTTSGSSSEEQKLQSVRISNV